MRTISFLGELYSQFTKDNAPSLAAALAYFAIFSFAPLLVIIIAITGLVYGKDAAQGHIVEYFEDSIGQSGAHAVQNLILSVSQPTYGIIATAIGLVLLIWTASQIFQQLNLSLNLIWNIERKPGLGLKRTIKNYAVSILLVFVTGLLLLLTILVSTMITAAIRFFQNQLPFHQLIWVWHLGFFLLSFVITTVIFAMIFKYIADADIDWIPTWYGAFVTSLLFSIGRFIIGFYLGMNTFHLYGTAASLVIFLLWIYYSAQILFFGAEFTQVYAKLLNKPIKPVSYSQIRVCTGENSDTKQ